MTKTRFTNPPQSESELLSNARGLTGKSLQQLATEIGLQVPSDQKRAKGWTGEMIEIYLGATASSLPEPDFQHIGVELKTIPLNQKGKPKETTFVCTVSLEGNSSDSWENSTVKRKLQRVLWVPVEADPSISLARRRIGNPFIWSPNMQQEIDLRTDWQELVDMIRLGELSTISSKHGACLQIRPKAANSRILSQTTIETGEIGMTLPRGFYLRQTFTHMLLKDYQNKS